MPEITCPGGRASSYFLRAPAMGQVPIPRWGDTAMHKRTGPRPGEADSLVRLPSPAPDPSSVQGPSSHQNGKEDARLWNLAHTPGEGAEGCPAEPTRPVHPSTPPREGRSLH